MPNEPWQNINLRAVDQGLFLSFSGSVVRKRRAFAIHCNALGQRTFVRSELFF